MLIKTIIVVALIFTLCSCESNRDIDLATDVLNNAPDYKTKPKEFFKYLSDHSDFAASAGAGGVGWLAYYRISGDVWIAFFCDPYRVKSDVKIIVHPRKQVHPNMPGAMELLAPEWGGDFSK